MNDFLLFLISKHMIDIDKIAIVWKDENGNEKPVKFITTEQISALNATLLLDLECNIGIFATEDEVYLSPTMD